ncbi:MAG TPA: hypothetical protein VHV79_03365 [Mycobacteriales bacterium]|nr:hypothetical protein [Mycobacteriales bacterium]
MRPLPLRYFLDVIDGTGYDALPSAYLAFGEQYADERESRGGRRLANRHSDRRRAPQSAGRSGGSGWHIDGLIEALG